MNKRYILAAAGTLAVILFIIGAVMVIEKNRAPMQLENAATLYQNASDATRDISNVVYNVSRTLETTIDVNTFSVQTKSTVSCIDLGSDLMQVSIQEYSVSGKHKSNISEIYQNGTAYFSVNDCKFSCEMSSVEFQKKMIPAVPLTGKLYGEIAGVDTHEEYVIYLSSANEPEDWLDMDGMMLTKASGTAYISYSGMLTKSVYNAEYTDGSVQFRLSIITELTEETPEVKSPDETALYTKVQNLDGLRMLEQASGYITQMENVHAKSSEITYFEAFGDRRTQEISVQIKKDTAWSANIETSIHLSNDGRIGQDSEYFQSEVFKNGIYTLAKIDAPPAQNDEITEERMQIYCQNILVSTIMLPEYITQCTVNHSENRIWFTYKANEAFATQVNNNACQTLYQDATLLERISQNNTAQTVTGYLDIDRITGLPIGSGLQYSGTYTSEGIEYQMQFSTGQIYEIGQP